MISSSCPITYYIALFRIIIATLIANLFSTTVAVADPYAAESVMLSGVEASSHKAIIKMFRLLDPSTPQTPLRMTETA